MRPRKSRLTLATAFTLTSVERWICQNCCGSSSSMSSFSGFRISDALIQRSGARGAGSRARAELVQHAGERRRRLALAEPRLQPRDGREQPRAGPRLEQVVDRALVARGDGVLVVGRDEDHVRAAAHLAGHVDAGGAGHLDVQEHDVGAVPVEQAQRLQAVGRLADESTGA
jgi:hypothetical protein